MWEGVEKDKLMESDGLVFDDFSLNKIIALVGKGTWENAERLIWKLSVDWDGANFEDGLILYPEELNLVPQRTRLTT